MAFENNYLIMTGRSYCYYLSVLIVDVEVPDVFYLGHCGGLKTSTSSVEA